MRRWRAVDGKRGALQGFTLLLLYTLGTILLYSTTSNSQIQSSAPWPSWGYDKGRSGIQGSQWYETPQTFLPEPILVWRMLLPTPLVEEYHSSPVINRDLQLIAATNNTLHCVTYDGVLKWSYPTTALISGSPVVNEDGTIYVGNHDGDFHAINADGSTKWVEQLGAAARSSPNIGDDGTVYICSGGRFYKHPLPEFHNETGWLHAFHPNGTELWKVTTGWACANPVIDDDDKIWAGHYYSYYPNGTLFWHYEPQNPLLDIAYPTSGPVVYKNLISHLTLVDEFAFVFDTNGTLIAETAPGLSSGIAAKLTVAPNCGHVIPTLMGDMICGNPADLNVVWTKSGVNVIEGSPITVGDGIFFGDWSATLYLESATTGDFIWQWQGLQVLRNSPAPGTDGWLFLLQNGELLAFATSERLVVHPQQALATDDSIKELLITGGHFHVKQSKVQCHIGPRVVTAKVINSTACICPFWPFAETPISKLEVQVSDNGGAKRPVIPLQFRYLLEPAIDSITPGVEPGTIQVKGRSISTAVECRLDSTSGPAIPTLFEDSRTFSCNIGPYPDRLVYALNQGKGADGVLLGNSSTLPITPVPNGLLKLDPVPVCGYWQGTNRAPWYLPSIWSEEQLAEFPATGTHRVYRVHHAKNHPGNVPNRQCTIVSRHGINLLWRPLVDNAATWMGMGISAYNSYNGSMLWERLGWGTWNEVQMLVLAPEGDAIYAVLDRNVGISKLDIHNGSTIWSRDFKSTPTVNQDHLNTLTVTPLGHVIMVWRVRVISITKDGDLLWDTPLNTTVNPYSIQPDAPSEPVLSPDGTRVFVTVLFRLHCLDTATGQVLWNITGPGEFSGREDWQPWAFSVSDSGDRLYLTSRQTLGRVYCYNAHNGDKIWEYRDPQGLPLYVAPSLLSNDNIVSASWSADLDAVSMISNTGSRLWVNALRSGQSNHQFVPSTVAWDDSFLANGGTDHLTMMSTTDGSVIDKLPYFYKGDNWWSQPLCPRPSLDRNNVLWHAHQGNITAFRLDPVKYGAKQGLLFLRDPPKVHNNKQEFAVQPILMALDIDINSTSPVGQLQVDVSVMEPGGELFQPSGFVFSSVITFTALGFVGVQGQNYTLKFDAINAKARPMFFKFRVMTCEESKPGSNPSPDGKLCLCSTSQLDLSVIQDGAGCIYAPKNIKFLTPPPATHTVVKGGLTSVISLVVEDENGGTFNPELLVGKSHTVHIGMASTSGNNTLLSGTQNKDFKGPSVTFDDLQLITNRGDVTVFRVAVDIALPNSTHLTLEEWFTVTTPTCAVARPGSSQVIGQDLCSCSVGFEPDGLGCRVCPSGSVKQNVGETTCECDINYRSTPGGTCEACPVGSSFKNFVGPGSCTCSAGFFLDRSVDPNGACTKCPSGTFKDKPGPEECQCLANHYSTTVGGECLACPRGSQKNVTGPGSCHCLPQYYRNGPNSCSPCLPGSYADKIDSAFCDCEPKFWSLDPSQPDQPCRPCPAGSSKTTRGAGRCICDAGRYLVGDACELCPPGSFKNEPGQERCKCIPGWFKDASGGCIECNPNSYSTTVDAPECTACPAFSSTENIKGASSPDQCVCIAGYFSNANIKNSAADTGSRNGNGGGSGSNSSTSTSMGNSTALPSNLSGLTGNVSTVAVPGIDPLPRDSTSGVQSGCQSCPPEADCAGGGAAIKTKPRFWRASNDSLVFYECRSYGDFCLGDDQCKTGHTGTLCQECAEGYGKFGNECNECEGTDWVAMILIVLSFLGVLVYLVYASTKPFSLPEVLIKIFLSYAQFMMFIATFGFNYPRSIYQWFVYSSFSSPGPQFIAIECTLTWSTNSTSMYFFLFAFALSGSLVLALCLVLLSRTYPSLRAGKFMNFVILFTRTVVIVIVFTHPAIVVEAMSAFQCEDIDGVSLLSKDLTIVCTSDSHRVTQRFALVTLLLFGIGTIALIFAVLLTSIRMTRGIDEVELNRASEDPSDPKYTWIRAQSIFIFLSDPYRQGSEWWELIVLGRRTMILGISATLAKYPGFQAFLGVLVIQMSLGLVLFYRPYADNWLHPTRNEGVTPPNHAFYGRMLRSLILLGPRRMDVFCLVANLVTILIGPLFSETTPYDWVLITMFFAVNGLVVAMLIWIIVGLISNIVYGVTGGKKEAHAIALDEFMPRKSRSYSIHASGGAGWPDDTVSEDLTDISGHVVAGAHTVVFTGVDSLSNDDDHGIDDDDDDDDPIASGLPLQHRSSRSHKLHGVQAIQLSLESSEEDSLPAPPSRPFERRQSIANWLVPSFMMDVDNGGNGDDHADNDSDDDDDDDDDDPGLAGNGTGTRGGNGHEAGSDSFRARSASIAWLMPSLAGGDPAPGGSAARASSDD